MRTAVLAVLAGCSLTMRLGHDLSTDYIYIYKFGTITRYYYYAETDQGVTENEKRFSLPYVALVPMTGADGNMKINLKKYDSPANIDYKSALESDFKARYLNNGELKEPFGSLRPLDPKWIFPPKNLSISRAGGWEEETSELISPDAEIIEISSKESQAPIFDAKALEAESKKESGSNHEESKPREPGTIEPGIVEFDEPNSESAGSETRPAESQKKKITFKLKYKYKKMDRFMDRECALYEAIARIKYKETKRWDQIKGCAENELCRAVLDHWDLETEAIHDYKQCFDTRWGISLYFEHEITKMVKQAIYGTKSLKPENKSAKMVSISYGVLFDWRRHGH